MQSYVQGLEHMLLSQGLGTYILVLANAAYHDEVYHRLKTQLQARYAELAASANDIENDESDDARVFKQIMDTGVETLITTERKRLGPWSMQYNRLRSFRPPRSSNQVVRGLQAAFDPEGFHFNKPFLKKEIWWEGNLEGRHSRLLYNKFPFADYHGLLVIGPEQNRSQLLTNDIHQYVWHLVEAVCAQIKGFGLGYNSYGAAASVNHLHFQSYVRDSYKYPVEDTHWSHHGGSDEYPLKCFKETTPGSAWERIELMHAENTAYNLLYRPGIVYIIPRRFQGQFNQASWLTGLGWSDLAGEFTVIDREVYEQLTPQQFDQQLVAAGLDELSKS